MRKLFVCHAGTGFPVDRHDDMGIIGMVYVWNGEWHRSPEWAEGRERNPVMKLQPLFEPSVEVWGDLGCFTEIERALELVDEDVPA